MSYPGTSHAPYEIRIVQESADSLSVCVRTQLHLDDVDALPTAVKKLAELGYDLNNTAKALREVEEKQRQCKRNELDENRRMALAGLEAKSKRFVIAYNKVGETSVGTVEGVIYGDDSIHIANSAAYSFGGHYNNEEYLKSITETLGYELFVKHFD